jgi:hypothetical protein
MKTLRTLHLYLGCIFAPMLIFFAVSGLWQMFGLLSSIHTAHGLKAGPHLMSLSLFCFIVAMALSFIFTIVLGIFMAFRLGHKRTAIYCLLTGIAIPSLFILLALYR